MSDTIKLNGIDYTIIDAKNDSVWGYVEKLFAEDGEVLGYKVNTNIAYFSLRYRKWIGVEVSDKSDGATFAKDINTFAWLFHDELCACGVFEDLTDCNNLQASMVCNDLLKSSGHWFRAKTWLAATWLFGGGRARKNGMW